jgi:hypothetical protein
MLSMVHDARNTRQLRIPLRRRVFRFRPSKRQA